MTSITPDPLITASPRYLVTFVTPAVLIVMQHGEDRSEIWRAAAMEGYWKIKMNQQMCFIANRIHFPATQATIKPIEVWLRPESILCEQRCPTE